MEVGFLGSADFLTLVVLPGIYGVSSVLLENYRKRHMRVLTKTKLMRAKQKVNVHGVYSATTDGNPARKIFGLVRPE